MRDYKEEYAGRVDKKRGRKEPYAMDSTKGSSLINPVNYKGDVLVQVWIDSRVLATITRWMDGKGYYPRYMSQAVRRPLEVLAGFLVDSDEVEMVDDTAEARKMLERRFNVELNRGGRGTKNVVHNLALSDRRGELGERINREMRIFDVNKPTALRSDVRTRNAVDKYNELFGKESGNGKVGSDERFSELHGIQPVVREGMSEAEAAEVMRRNEEEEQKKLDALNSMDLASLMSGAIKE